MPQNFYELVWIFIIYAFCLPVILCVHTLLSLWLKEVPRYTEVFVIWNLMESICAVLLAPNWTMTLASGKLRKYVLMCNLANDMKQGKQDMFYRSLSQELQGLSFCLA